MRSILTKGPKYRLPAFIDFDKCLSVINDAILDFSAKWCRRENADPVALDDWKSQVLYIVNTRIDFYKSNNQLLPPKPKTSYRYLKNEFQKFHSNFVLVPADKASNNVIII